MSAPLVSIVIPVFNQARFVLETVGSAVSQNYRNLEVIVVDDGSTDGTDALLAREFGDAITLIRQRNAGPSAALNAGIEAARGSFIALLGGDDVCLENRIATQLEIAESTGHDIVFSKPDLIDADGSPLADEDFPVFFREAPKENLLRVLLLQGNFICAPSAFIRRTVVEKIGLFHPGLIQLQDYDFWMRALAAGFRLGEFEPRIVKYRRHAANLSSRKGSFASKAEAIPIVKSILEKGQPQHLRAAFAHIFTPAESNDAPVSELDKTLLLLSHPREEIRIVGVEYAVALLADDAFRKEAARFDFDLFRFLRNAA